MFRLPDPANILFDISNLLLQRIALSSNFLSSEKSNIEAGPKVLAKPAKNLALLSAHVAFLPHFFLLHFVYHTLTGACIYCHQHFHPPCGIVKM